MPDTLTISSVFQNGFQRFSDYVTFNEKHLKTTFSDINKKNRIITDQLNIKLSVKLCPHHYKIKVINPCRICWCPIST